jgi:hypothetical protein
MVNYEFLDVYFKVNTSLPLNFFSVFEFWNYLLFSNVIFHHFVFKFSFFWMQYILYNINFIPASKLMAFLLWNVWIIFLKFCILICFSTVYLVLHCSGSMTQIFVGLIYIFQGLDCLYHHREQIKVILTLEMTSFQFTESIFFSST